MLADSYVDDGISGDGGGASAKTSMALRNLMSVFFVVFFNSSVR